MSLRLSGRLLAAQSDRRLVELIGAGHERAFEVLVQRYRRQLLRYCARMGLSEQLAEDVVQHTLLQAWVALERGTEVREPRPWLYRIAHNTAISAARRAREEQQVSAGVTIDMRASSEHDPQRRMALRDTLADVAALPPMQREAIVLSAIDGRSHEEVAGALGVSDGAVRGLLYRARVTLRDAAAVLTPAPLLGWASGAVTRVTPTAARLAELSASGSDGGGALLFKGVAVAATAVLAAGAVLGPLHGRHASAHRAATRSLPASEAHASVSPATASPARLVVSAGASAVTLSPGAHTLRLGPGAGSNRVTGTGFPALHRSPTASAPGAAPGATNRQVAVLGPDTAQSGSGATATRVEAASTGGGGATQPVAPEAPKQAPTPTAPPSTTEAPPAPKPTGGEPEGREAPSENAEREADAARELKEREAEQTRETREREEEAARERHEREEEAAGELREREAEASHERAGK